VCVISHTNAAREEIEKLLSAHPSAGAFLNYPHFVGTVTKFVDHFIALPYLRGLGWSVRRIDDEVFTAVACAKLASKPRLRAMARSAEHMKGWIAGSHEWN
jgi:ATP-dependent DNA helicase UvrD/PcrA